MCLIIFASRLHPEYPLIVAANRDEFYERETRPAGWWSEAPGVYGGRDLKHGGTWMGISSGGRFAAITNYREVRDPPAHPLSRGLIVHDYLVAGQPPFIFLKDVMKNGDRYRGFNLIIGHPGRLFYYSNRKNGPEIIGPGIHTLSNRLLDTPWPKSVRGKKAFSRVIQDDGGIDPDALMDILLDRTAAADERLPDTGFDLEWEKILSPVFIISETYGTRNSTVIMVDRRGLVTYRERSFRYPGDPGSESCHRFRLEGKP